MQAQSILTDQVYPAASQHVDLSPVYHIDMEFFALERQMDRTVPTRGSVLEIPRSLNLSNAILLRTSWLGSALSESKRLLVHFEDLQSLITTGIN